MSEVLIGWAIWIKPAQCSELKASKQSYISQVSMYFMPGSSHILVTSFLVFCHLGCVIFCTMFSVCKARWAR